VPYKALAEYRTQQSMLSFSASSGADLLQSLNQAIPNKVGRYEIEGQIGQGGMGQVYKARDPDLGRTVAVKVLQGRGKESVERFAREACVLAQLHHPNIIPIFEAGMHEESVYYVMPLVEGGSLAEHVQDYVGNPRAAAALMEKVARAVEYAHEHGFLHRDLKPANIMLDERGDPLVADFGLAKLLKTPDSELTVSGQIIGTPAYMSPEQVRGEGAHVGPAADVYSLGAILYHLLTGRVLFRDKSIMETMAQALKDMPIPPSRLQANVPRDLEAICLKCLEKDPGHRYRTAGTLADDLASWLQDKAITARSAGVAQTWLRRIFGR
jgi:serine/threonine protein kinase